MHMLNGCGDGFRKLWKSNMYPLALLVVMGATYAPR